MAKPPMRAIESDADYDWRMAVEHPDRYPLNGGDRRFERRITWGRRWQWLGQMTGVWRPFLAWARGADLVD